MSGTYVEYLVAAVKERLIKWGVALVLTGALLACVLMVTTGFIKAVFSYHSKPSIQLVKPPAPACKVCHCHKVSCHKECGEENMCNLRCEGLCQTTH